MDKPDGFYYPILSEEELYQFCNHHLKDIDRLAVDTEASSVDPITCDLYGVSISPEPELGVYIPIAQEYTLGEQISLFAIKDSFLELATVVKYLKPVLSDPNILKIMHNAKYDIHVLNRYGFNITPPFYDTIIGAWVYGNINGGRYGLKELTKRKLRYDMLTFKEVVGRNKFWEVDINLATMYASADTDMTLRLSDLLEDTRAKYPSLESTLEVELNIIPILYKMEKRGVLIDVAYLEESKIPIQNEMDAEKETIKRFFNNPTLNVDSPPQILEEITTRWPKIGVPSTEETILLKIISDNEDKHPEFKKCMDSLLTYRGYAKLMGTYLEGIINRVNPDTGRLHTSFKQHGIKTGRLSSRNPNLQNIPFFPDKRTGVAIRRALIAEDNWWIVGIDYSQLELRILAHFMAQMDPNIEHNAMIQAFITGKDVHTSTAASLYGVEMDEVEKWQRKNAKTVNFGLVYGQTPYGLSKRMNMSQEEAEEFINDYFSKYPGVKLYVENTKKKVMRERFVETLIGRRLYFSFHNRDMKAKGAAQREGINAPIQGTAADIMKLSMIEIDSLLDNYQANMIIQVHDEVVLEIPDEEMNKVIPQIVNIMSNIKELAVPLQVDVEYGHNWYDIEEWKND